MENEIRIRSLGRMKNSLNYVIERLQTNNTPFVTIKATGYAIPKAIQLAETVKRMYPGLHQNTSIGTTHINDTKTQEPGYSEEQQTERTVTFIAIELLKQIPDTISSGYQAPISEELLQQYKETEHTLTKRANNRPSNYSKPKKSTSPQASNTESQQPANEVNQTHLTETTATQTTEPSYNTRAKNNHNTDTQNKARKPNKGRKGPKATQIKQTTP